MSEFGHAASVAKMGGYATHLDSWGAGPFVISRGNRSWRFEDSDRFGPAIICKNGELRKNPYPDEKSQFWHIHKLWVSQGRRLAEDGENCVYDAEH